MINNCDLLLKTYKFVIIFLLLIIQFDTTVAGTQIPNNFISNFTSLPSNAKLEPRIVGGWPANITGNEHMVSIRAKDVERFYGFGTGHICGGSLIKNNTVLTAAHCFYMAKVKAYMTAKDIVVVMGVLLRTDRGKAHIRAVDKLIIHENYNPKTNDNDIAVMILKEAYSITNSIKIVKLASESDFQVGQTAKLAGWGSTRYSGTGTNELRETTIKIVKHDECRSSYRNLGIHITGTMFCAAETNKDSCQGDSGGPLLIGNTQYGIVSFGYGCAVPNFPGVYTNVAMHKEWIKRNSANQLILERIYFFLIVSCLMLLK